MTKRPFRTSTAGRDRGSPACCKGTFGDRRLTGAWVYPGGGGCDSIAERVG
ncbi:hypothetical protein [Actinomadura sp. SCN-SB]|uniref:hypothetical protein n=1 Tax=Actinomadura sp. SCN-SB TaxID=3373092 RepID=UPI003753A36C